MVKVKFFAALRERLNCAELTLDCGPNETLATLRARLVDLHPSWQTELHDRDVLCAKNFSFCGWQDRVSAGDELAFFPPVTGG
ncbi:MoaD/ThiS family protein [Pseudidiomarina sp. YC-516-91]|uniref:MoaD/ThiS family protein n=1 Tax=Pseudidiomarina salilacus TaxID=3384452 RepID=UPI003984AE80